MSTWSPAKKIVHAVGALAGAVGVAFAVSQTRTHAESGRVGREIRRLAGLYGVDRNARLGPPYVEKGKYYRHRLSKEDYPRLAGWCLDLPGDVVVCEQHGANWLPFEPLATIKSTRGTSAEVVCLHTARSVCAPFEGRARG
jgi:hypothetical protein